MKTWQKLAITAGVILVAMIFFTSVAPNGPEIVQNIVDWVMKDLFNLPTVNLGLGG